MSSMSSTKYVGTKTQFWAVATAPELEMNSVSGARASLALALEESMTTTATARRRRTFRSSMLFDHNKLEHDWEE